MVVQWTEPCRLGWQLRPNSPSQLLSNTTFTVMHACIAKLLLLSRWIVVFVALQCQLYLSSLCFALCFCRQESWAIAKKTARCAQYMGALKSFESPHYAPATFPEVCNGLLFRSILRMCVQNLKFVALPVPEIIGDTQKNLGSPGCAHVPFSPKMLKGFCWHGPCEYTFQIWSS